MIVWYSHFMDEFYKDAKFSRNIINSQRKLIWYIVVIDEHKL